MFILMADYPRNHGGNGNVCDLSIMCNTSSISWSQWPRGLWVRIPFKISMFVLVSSSSFTCHTLSTLYSPVTEKVS
jgi:hypothetical protein